MRRLLRIALICIDLGQGLCKEIVEGVLRGDSFVALGALRSGILSCNGRIPRNGRIRFFLCHGAEGVVAVLLHRGILLGGEIVAADHNHPAGGALVLYLSYTFIYIRAQEFLYLDVGVVGLVALVMMRRDPM